MSPIPKTGRSSFHGAGYEPNADIDRLSTQMERIRLYMYGTRWRTLEEIEHELGRLYPDAHFPAASISAQLRNLKKAPHCCRLEKRRRGDPRRGLWEYQLLPPIPAGFAGPVEQRALFV